jgi:hypothetical protein
MIPSFSQEHQGSIRGDSHDPGLKAALGAKSRKITECADQGILEDVLCIFRIANNAANPPLQQRSVAAAQFHEGLLVAASRCRNQLAFASGLITGARVTDRAWTLHLSSR